MVPRVSVNLQRIDAVIRREQFGRVKAALERQGCPGMMVFMMRGHGRQGGLVDRSRGRRFKMDLLPKVLLVVYVSGSDADRIVAAIAKSARTGKIGDGKIFVSSVDRVIRIRTGEQGPKAV